MTTYQVTAWCNVPYYTIFEVDAASINEALANAKHQARDQCGEPCGGESEWDAFEIASEGGADEYVRHLEPAWLGALAAPELLDALQQGGEVAQHVMDAWERGDLTAAVRALSEWLADARAVIAKATKP